MNIDVKIVNKTLANKIRNERDIKTDITEIEIIDRKSVV